MDWYFVLTSAAVGAVIGAVANIVIERIKNNHEIRSYRVKELHRILIETETVHGFLNCTTPQQINERIYFFWANLEIIKPLIEKKGRPCIDQIINEFSSSVNSSNGVKLETMNKMVFVLKHTLQDQITKLV
jgi:hypothetical protein